MPILKFRRARSADFILYIFCFLILIDDLVLDGSNFKKMLKNAAQILFDARLVA